jgi:hypothetical protein
MSKQKLKHQIEEIFLELNLQDLPLTTTFEASVNETTGILQQETSQQEISKKSPHEITESQPGVDENTLFEINKTIDLIPYILGSFSQINGLSNLLIQGIDGALSDQQLLDVIAIRKISESQSFLLKEIEELSRHSQVNETEKNTAFTVHDLLTQIQKVFLKGEYRGVISLDINCPLKIPSLFTDSVFLRRSIIHSLELMVLFGKEIVIDVEKIISDHQEQTIHIHIHQQKSTPPNKPKPPSSAIQKSAKLHQFFIERWIDQLDGRVIFEQDTNNRFSSAHIYIPVLDDPNANGAQENGFEKHTVLLIGQATPAPLKEAVNQLDWTLKQIKNKNEMDSSKQNPIHTCFINLAEYQTKWQDINDCLFEISASDIPVVPIFHEPKKQISVWFPEVRILINPIEPNEISSLVRNMTNQYHFNHISVLDKSQYIVQSLKSLEKQYAIQSISDAKFDCKNFPGSMIMIINLQLSPNDEIFEGTSIIQECFIKKIPIIILLPEEIDRDQAKYFQNAIKSIIAVKDCIKTQDIVEFLT